MKTIKIIDQSCENNIKEVKGHHLEVNGHEFIMCTKEHFEFYHTYSGLGFNGDFSHKKTNMLESFHFREKAMGKRKFWKCIKEAISIEAKLKEIELIKAKNEKKRKLMEELSKILPFKLKFDSWGIMAGGLTLDVIRLDYEMKYRFRSEYKDGISTKQFITQKFGEEIATKIHSLI